MATQVKFGADGIRGKAKHAPLDPDTLQQRMTLRKATRPERHVLCAPRPIRR